MSAATPIVGKNDFRLGYRLQHFWDFPMAAAFFFGELGAGLCLVSLYYEFTTGLVTGLILVGVGKPYFHLSHMGVPTRSWRAILRPDRSWISRGLIGIVCLIGFAVAHLAITRLDASSWVGLGGAADLLASATWMLTAIAALVVVTYQGFAMSQSPAIGLWRTPLIPVCSLLYGLAGGASLTLVLDAAPFVGFLGDEVSEVGTLLLTLLCVLAVAITTLLAGARNGSSGSRKSFELLTKMPLAAPFAGLTVVVGLIVPAVLLLATPHDHFSAVIITAATLTGFLAFRVLVFKVGVYEPIISFAPQT